MPFWERDADEMLERLIATDRLDATVDPKAVAEAEHVVLVVGTPVDEHLNPDPKFVRSAVEGLLDQLRDGQHIVLRSTVYPRVTAMVEKLLVAAKRDVDLSFCPERIAEGKALEELRTLPQIVSARTPRAVQRAEGLFGNIAPSIVHLDVEEAELAKLFANTWRYIQFAAANQLFMIANDFGLDFGRIREALKQDYPRLAGMPGPGLAAGPCLLKDTMQLAAFNNNNFTLGHASMMINEGLPLYMVSRLEQEYDLSEMTVGILGMAFKAESDDTRSSLSYKLKRLLRFRAARVLCTDPYAQHDVDLSPLAEVLAVADLIVIATPHRQYADIAVDVPVVDVWNLLGNGERV
jgi:UDP-N-acetyl-D-mannosaminuronic acid dehydrogenase